METLAQAQALVGDFKAFSAWAYNHFDVLLTLAAINLTLCFLGVVWIITFTWKHKWFLASTVAVVFVGSIAFARIF